MHLGPLGGLVEIHPLTGVSTPSKRTGGVHTSISGRRTVDYTGNLAEFTLEWKHRTPDEMVFLEAIHHRHIRGPLRFLMGSMKPNRLSRSAASLAYGGRDKHGVTLTAGTSKRSTLWPSAAPPAGDSLVWSNWAVGDALQLDRNQPVPVLPGETVTASVYVRSAYADAVRLDLDHYGASGYSGSTAGTAVTLTANTWTRLTITATPTSDVWAVSPSITPTVKANTASDLTLAAAQAEATSTASAWTLGGGALVVAVDQLPTESLYAPFTDAKLTLLEI